MRWLWGYASRRAAVATLATGVVIAGTLLLVTLAVLASIQKNPSAPPRGFLSLTTNMVRSKAVLGASTRPVEVEGVYTSLRATYVLYSIPQQDMDGPWPPTAAMYDDHQHRYKVQEAGLAWKQRPAAVYWPAVGPLLDLYFSRAASGPARGMLRFGPLHRDVHTIRFRLLYAGRTETVMVSINRATSRWHGPLSGR